METAVGFFNTVLLAFAGIGIFVGAFLIQNTYRIVVAQRTRELGMLRAVGATGRQVTWMVILEALVVGLLASAVGVGVGVLLAVGLRALFGLLGIDFPQGALTVAPRTVIVGMVVGTVVTVASAILPARKASKIPPVAACRELESTYYKSLRLRAAVGAGIVVLGVALLLVGLYTGVWNPLAVTGIGAGVTFVGVSTVAPLFARAVRAGGGQPAAPGLRGGRPPGPGERGAQAAAHGGHRLGPDDRGGPGDHRGHHRRLGEAEHRGHGPRRGHRRVPGAAGVQGNPFAGA